MTVSQVLNGHNNSFASAKNRALIIDVAQRLHYQPNLNARRLVKKQSEVIGVLIDTKAPEFVQNVLNELVVLARARNLRLQVAPFHDSLEAISEYVSDFQGNGITSVISLAHTYPAFGMEIPKLMDSFENVVFLEKPLAPTRFPYISADHYRNFFDMTATMLNNGYRRIIIPRMDYQDEAYHESKRGQEDAYKAAGIPFESDFWTIVPSLGVDSEEDAEEILNLCLPLKPDVLVVTNDTCAMRIINLLEKRNITVPKDLALFCADYSQYNTLFRPTLSGINYDGPAIARKIFQQLFQEGDGSAQSDTSRSCLIPSKLVWLDSCPNLPLF